MIDPLKPTVAAVATPPGLTVTPGVFSRWSSKFSRWK
jgi:hypothetical protein